MAVRSAQRMAASLFKLAAAHARGNGRSEVQTSDIGRAICFLHRKMAFLRSLVLEHSYLFAGNKQQRRTGQAGDHFGPEPFTPEDYAAATGTSRATAYRDV